MIIRASEAGDAGALAAIYGHHVLHGFGTFEEIPPSAADMETRRRAIIDLGLPYMVAEDAGAVLGRPLGPVVRPRDAAPVFRGCPAPFGRPDM